MSEQVHGRELIDRPEGHSPARHYFCRLNNVGHRVAVPSQYAGANSQGHEIIAAVFEVSGGMNPEVVELLGRLAKAHANKLPLDLRGLSWTATTFSRYFRQHLSMAIHKSVASELMYHMRLGLPPTCRKGRKATPKSRGAANAANLAAFGVAGMSA